MTETHWREGIHDTGEYRCQHVDRTPAPSRPAAAGPRLDQMDLPLPPIELRRGGGRLRNDDRYFIESGKVAAETLFLAGLERGMRLIDLGSGPGRLALGLIASAWSGEYLGVEVNGRQAKWANSHITSRWPEFRFVRVDAPNARYNPDGSDVHRLPVANETVDFICAFSVFSHMTSDETSAYLSEFHRVLRPGAKAFVTAYVADNVPDETENPEWLRSWSGRLHGVLYSTDHLGMLIETAGLTLLSLSPRAERQQAHLTMQRLPS